MTHVDHQIAEINRRVIRGEQIGHEEKAFSLFEPHTEWISKGKAVEMVQATRSRFSELHSCRFDKGFHSPSNQGALREELEGVGLPHKGPVIEEGGRMGIIGRVQAGEEGAFVETGVFCQALHYRLISYWKRLGFGFIPNPQIEIPKT